MSKIFVNNDPHGADPVRSAAQSDDDTAKDAAQLLAAPFGLAILAGVCLLLYQFWKFAAAFLLAAVLFACPLSSVVTIGFMCVAMVVLAIIGNAARAQTVVDGDTIRLNGTTYWIWGIDAAETKQRCQDGWEAGREATLGAVTTTWIG
jgi:hypothetical protein